MNLKVIALASLLGLSAPALTDIVLSPQQAVSMPTDFVRPEGYFQDRQGAWIVNLYLDEFGVFNYYGKSLKNGSSLKLKNPEISGNQQRYTYTFTNVDYKYIIAYQSSDTEYIRLTVVNPQGQVILNQLMEKVGTSDWDI